MARWKHKHSKGTFYKHECNEQNENTKCITCYVAKVSEFHLSRGWGIDNEDFDQDLINYCPYCGLKLEMPKPKFDARPWVEAADAIAKVFDEWSKAVRDDLMARTERLFLGDKPEPPDVKIELSRKTLKEWADYAQAIVVHAMADRLTSASCTAASLESWIKRILND